MLERVLNPPVRVGNSIIRTLDEAAYVLRQFAIKTGDRDAWKLARALRDVGSDDEFSLQSLESRLRVWCLINKAHHTQ